LLGAHAGRAAEHPANSKNVASAANGASDGQCSQRGRLGPSADVGFSSWRGASSKAASDGVGVGLASMPLASVLGDITNRVRASCTLGSKVPKAFGVQPLQPQSAHGAFLLPAPTLAESSELMPRPGSLLSSTGPAPTRLPSPHAVLFCSVFEGDAQDPQRASEYAADVFARLLDKESLLLPKPDYMEKQTDINRKMRAILIDWLAEVHAKYRLRHETLFLTVNIIDRYLSVRPILRKKLQLLGVVAMFIAAKYEEIDPPKVREFSYITDHTCSKEEIVTMECDVLVALDYQIAVPTPVHFLDRLQRVNGCDVVHRSLAQYALELSLLDLRSLRHPPSVIVSAALLMSNEFLGKQPVWPAAMVHHSRRSEPDLRACAADLRELLETAKTASLQAVQRKYQLDINHAVANLSPCQMQK